jgi:hypothetical protein
MVLTDLREYTDQAGIVDGVCIFLRFFVDEAARSWMSRRLLELARSCVLPKDEKLDALVL